ncbi:metal-dependent transcriptional regulator [Treponema parvum]|uniref:Transcriptional regulator MntR n=1 Tax=Treponema parvum TaxID=138851 RepID=A0A975F4S2_9SPIR|nr:metal-dependent transcriptional regulator [Treponema parvum]QTQ14452.1 metal-dependent transcriptional regulator [Treponema parvum]
MYESREDYLETVLMLQQQNGFVRSVDIANHLKVSKPSVSRAMDILSEGGYITFGLGNMIKLTEEGEKKARSVYGRHIMLTDFFVKITGVSREQAEENACRVEHAIDRDIENGIRKWLEENK